MAFAVSVDFPRKFEFQTERMRRRQTALPVIDRGRLIRHGIVAVEIQASFSSKIFEAL